MQRCLLKAKLWFCLEPTLLQDSAQAASKCRRLRIDLLISVMVTQRLSRCPLHLRNNTVTLDLWTEEQKAVTSSRSLVQGHWPEFNLLFSWCGSGGNRMSQRKEALQREALKWNLMHCESFSKLPCFFSPMMHCSSYLTADHLSVHCTSPLIEYLTSKQLRAITNQRMDSCPWTKAAASVRMSACHSNCRVWTTAWCLWFSNCFSCPPVVSSILENMPLGQAHLSSCLIWLVTHRTTASQTKELKK